MQIRLRIDSHLPVDRVTQAEFPENIRRDFFDSCFFGISQDAGV